MTECFAGVLYGVNARTSDLVAASKAHDKISQTLTALDLITRRRVRGVLRATYTHKKRLSATGKLGPAIRPSAVERVPVEVWSMISDGVITAGVEDARAEVREAVVCQECEIEDAEYKAVSLVESNAGDLSAKSDLLVEHLRLEARWAREADWSTKAWSSEWIDKADNPCTDNVCIRDKWANTIVYQAFRSEPFTALLATFGLYLPLPQVGPHSSSDLLSEHITPLAVQMRNSDNERVKTTLQLDSEDDTIGTSDFVDLPTELFIPDPGANARLARFCARYHVTTRHGFPAATQVLTRTECAKPVPGPSSAPRWMLIAKARA